MKLDLFTLNELFGLETSGLQSELVLSGLISNTVFSSPTQAVYLDVQPVLAVEKIQRRKMWI